MHVAPGPSRTSEPRTAEAPDLRAPDRLGHPARDHPARDTSAGSPHSWRERPLMPPGAAWPEMRVPVSAPGRWAMIRKG